MATLSPTRLAIFPWGDVIEEFLDPLGLQAEDFAGRMKGGWLFGYVAALATQGVSAVIVYGSERVDVPCRLVHAQTGAPIWLVPARRAGRGRSRRWPSAQAAVRWARTPLRAFQRVLVEEGCDAVMVQDYEHPRFDALVLLARRMGIGAYATFQGGDVNGSVLERAVRGFSLRACRAVIVPSARERRRLAAAYAIPPQRIFDVPNPVDTQEWSSEGRAKARAKLGIDPETFLVVNHGRIDIHRKGLDVALKAWARVAAEMPRARLTLIGSGQDDAAFERLVDATPACDWLRGYVTAPSMIREWLSAADVYLTLSRVEGMPVAPLEAMACGLPVVSSDAHGLADIFSGGEECGGLLVGRERHEEAAEALRRLGGDPSLRLRLGTRAREAVEQRYSSPAVGLALREVLSASHP